MQRGLGGFPHERLHQDGNREQWTRIDAKRCIAFLCPTPHTPPPTPHT
ncbi:hypothetical protein [Moorena bouillonii]|nr:hypothetical protein [Moorena bouillonii]NEQ89200.1 hypothetical protein [Moorena sp. SIO2I5]